MAKSLGNDISKYQGDVNYDVYKNNSNFVIIKATEGNGYTDTKFARNQSEARRVGLPLGYYHFARPDLGNTPEAEADYFLKVVGSPVEGEVYVLDYEPKSNPGDTVAWCKRFLDHVFSKIGVKCLIYLNQSQVKGFDWQSIIDAGYGLWIAAYTYDPNKNDFEMGKWPFAAIQQWTNKQEVPGIPAVADGNVFFGTITTFKKYGYKKPAEPTPPPGDNVEQLKKEIEQLKTQNQQLTADSATLVKKLENADLSIQTKDIELGRKAEIIEQQKVEIKQLKDGNATAISDAVKEALKNFRIVAKPYLYYNLEGGTLIGHGFTKLFGKDITPVNLPEELKGGES